jgi:HK97 family phage major capsid protein
MWIELTAPVKEHKAGEFLDAPDDTARAYVAAGLAKDAKDGPDKIILGRAMESFRTELSTFTRGVASSIQDTARSLTAGKRPNIEVVQDEADKTRGLGDFVRQVIDAGDPRDPENAAKARERLDRVYQSKFQRGMAEGQGSTGGFLTPVVYEQQILEFAAEKTVLSSAAFPVPLGARTVEWPALDQYAVPTAGQSAFFAGVKVFRKNENAARTASQPALKKVALNANDMTAYTEFSRDLQADATPAVDALITRLIGGAIGWREDWECLNGTGQGQCLGIYNAPCAINVTRNTGATIKYQDVFTMITRMLPSELMECAWIIHPYTFSTLLALADPSGKFIMLPYVVGEMASLNAGPRYQMLGIPVLVTEKAPALGSLGDLALVARSRYLLGRRAGLEIGLSEHFKFDTDQVAIRAKLRNDGQPQQVKPITLADGTSTVSMVVLLQ